MLHEQKRSKLVMKNTFVIHLLINVIFLVGCKSQTDLTVKYNLIKEISQEDQNFPSQFNYIFFCKCQNNKVVRLNVYHLRELYKDSSSNTDFETYLRKVLNEKSKINCKNFNTTFELDPEIKGQYEKMGKDYLLKSFCKEYGKDIYYLNIDIPQYQRNTIMYFLFINNYMSSEDDYLGTYVIRKL